VIDNSRSAGYGYECSTEVVGSAATVRIDNRPPRHVRWLTPGADTTAIPRDFQERYPEAYQAELEGFARCVLAGQPVAVGGADALAAYDLAVAADRSRRTGQPVRPAGGN
jgi:myo-inositol 2-dehydrogenase/D-chiro-inositol 1-dehydrogenase